MYLIKQIQVDNFEETVKSYNGVAYYIFNGVDTYFDFSSELFGVELKFNLSLQSDIENTKIKNKYLVTYANSYNVNPLKDGFKELVLTVGKKDEKIEGYIISIDYLYDVETNAEIIGSRDGNRLVLVLREGKYLNFTFSGNKKMIKVVDGKLLLIKEL